MDLFIRETCGDAEYRLRLLKHMNIINRESINGISWDSSIGEKKDLNPLLYSLKLNHDKVQCRPKRSDDECDRSRSTMLIHALAGRYGANKVQQVVVDGYIKHPVYSIIANSKAVSSCLNDQLLFMY